MHVYIFLYICVMWNPDAALGIANRVHYSLAKLIILNF